jgi:hypothetical protein
MTTGTYVLIDYAGTLNGSLNNITLGTAPAGFTYSLNNDASTTSINLVVSAVPEPAGWTLLTIGCAMVFGSFRTRSSRIGRLSHAG